MFRTCRTALLATALLAASPRLAPAQPPAFSEPTFLDKTLTRWAEQLDRSPKPALRRSAAFALGRMGDDAHIEISTLARRLRNDKDAGVREMAATALGEIMLDYRGLPATKWEAAREALEEALADKDPRVRRSAAYGLGAFGKVAAPSAQLLRKALADEVAAVRQNAAWALGRIGPEVLPDAVADLAGRLRDGDVLVRRDAAAALGKVGRPRGSPGAKPLVELVKAEKDGVVRKSALDALTHLVTRDDGALAAELEPLLESKDAEFARSVAFVMAGIGGKQAARSVDVLRKALADADVSVQAQAAAALAGLERDAAPAVYDLTRALSSSRDPFVRRNCALALVHIGPDARAAVPALAEALKPAPGAPTADTPRGRAAEQAREYAAEALHAIGFPDNAAALPTVRDVLARDRNRMVRHKCVWCVFNITDPADLEKHGFDKVLTKVVEEKDDFHLVVRFDAARVLAHILRERTPDTAVDVLLKMLKSKDLHVYKGTDAKVKGTPKEGTAGETEVTTALGGDGRFMIAQALGWLGAKGRNRKDVVDALREAAKDRDQRLRDAARKALAELDVEKE
jgi:HEAT repeat protein